MTKLTMKMIVVQLDVALFLNKAIDPQNHNSKLSNLKMISIKNELIDE